MSAEQEKVLYLGLRAKLGTYHYPVIRTELCANMSQALARWDQFTHMIFTSPTAVEYWPGPWDKEILAIGPVTAQFLKDRAHHCQIAPHATQEGIVELIRNMQGFFFIPRSRKARSVLGDYFKQNRIPHYLFDLYDTHFQRLQPVPSLEEFTEIVFTSPSTVEGFLRIYGSLPQGKKLTAIGPITQKLL